LAAHDWRGGSCADRRRSDRARLGPGCQATDLSVAQAVVAEREDLAGDRDLGDLLAAALGNALVAVAQRIAAGAGVLDERPAQRARALA
jgi:hypothetical protein